MTQQAPDYPLMSALPCVGHMLTSSPQGESLLTLGGPGLAGLAPSWPCLDILSKIGGLLWLLFFSLSPPVSRWAPIPLEQSPSVGSALPRAPALSLRSGPSSLTGGGSSSAFPESEGDVARQRADCSVPFFH